MDTLLYFIPYLITLWTKNILRIGLASPLNYGLDLRLFLCALKMNVHCIGLGEMPYNFIQVQSVDNVVLVLNILTDFLSTCTIDY